ncbi:MAG: hypothetical protein QM690_14190 [Sphingobium sp.]
MSEQSDLPQPLPLLIAHAKGRDRDWHRLCWDIDERMARIVFGKKEGAVAAIRLAWWEEALASDGTKGKGEPMLERWHGFRPGERDKERVHALAAAWRMLLDPAEMTEKDWRGFGEGRAALFALIARGADTDRRRRAGALWALWNAARHDPDRQRAEGAFAAAIALLEEEGAPSRVTPRPLQLAAAMAADDVRARVMPVPEFSLRQYLRMVGRAIFQ